jgi:hypothetical protein
MNLSPAQIAQLPPAQQQQYLQRMSPHEQALVAQAAAQARIAANRQFMRQSVEKIAYCPVAGGSGTTAAYNAGTTLVFDLPVVGSGYAKALLITYSLTVNCATGTSATYAANAAAPFNIFQELLLNYNGAQIRCHPYVLKVLDQTLGFGRGAQNAVIAGNNNATIAAQLVGTTPTAVGNNTWQGKILLRLNAIGQDSVPGVLPVMGVGNKPQLKLTCASGSLGPDPLLNPVAATGGSGNAVTITGNINVDMVFLDGTTMSDPGGLTLDITQEPTLQYFWDTPLNPLTANTLNRQHIATLLEHWYVISIVIDGQQSNAFSSLSNLQQFQLSADSVGQQNFKSYNVANNISVYDFYAQLRYMFGQDLDIGVIPWITAPTAGVVDPDNRSGGQVLNMQAGGYPAATHAYQVAAVGAVSGITPRVETFLVSMNYNGLKIA